MKHQKALVSIGLIAYNNANTLSDSLDSLLSQAYPNIEIIISDDASTDNTSEIAEHYAEKYDLIRFYRQDRNLGIAQNSNFVLQKARGTYFMWATDEDAWHTEYIKKLVKLLEQNPKAALAVSNISLFRDGFVHVSEIQFPSYSEGARLLYQMLQEPALLVWGVFRTETLEKVGGFHESNLQLFGGSDFITVFKVLLQGGLAVNPHVLFYKRDSGFTLNRFEILKQRQFSPDVMKRILRYLLYPLMFTIDLYYVLQSTLTSALSFKDKMRLTVSAFQWYWRVNSEIVAETVKGICHVFASGYCRGKKAK